MSREENSVLDAERVSKALRDYLRSHIVGPELELDADTRLDSLGLDSVNYVEMLLQIEREFGRRIPSRHLDLETFSSLRNLATCVLLHGEDADTEAKET